MTKKITKYLLTFLLFLLPLLLPTQTAGGQGGGLAPAPASIRSTGSSLGSGPMPQTGGEGSGHTVLPIAGLGESAVGGGLTYQVHVLGEVGKPGTYRMPASTRLTEALNTAGGVAGRGSERRIELRRKGGGGRRVDLLSFKLQGNLDAILISSTTTSSSFP